MWSRWLTEGMPRLGEYVEVAVEETDRTFEGHVVATEGTRVRLAPEDPLSREMMATAWRRWEGPDADSAVRSAELSSV